MTHVAVLMGGLSAERPVSLSSGNECADALEAEGFKVTRVDVSPTWAMTTVSSAVSTLRDAAATMATASTRSSPFRAKRLHSPRKFVGRSGSGRA